MDVGIFTLATVFDGTRCENPRPLARLERSLTRMPRAMSRSVNTHGLNRRSNRRERKRLAVRKLHTRIRNRREDAHHKATTAVAVAGGVTGVESLNVWAMRGTAVWPST